MHRFTPVPPKASSTILVESSAHSVMYDERKKDLYEGKDVELEKKESYGE